MLVIAIYAEDIVPPIPILSFVCQSVCLAFVMKHAIVDGKYYSVPRGLEAPNQRSRTQGKTETCRQAGSENADAIAIKACSGCMICTTPSVNGRMSSGLDSSASVTMETSSCNC